MKTHKLLLSLDKDYSILGMDIPSSRMKTQTLAHKVQKAKVYNKTLFITGFVIGCGVGALFSYNALSHKTTEDN